MINEAFIQLTLSVAEYRKQCEELERSMYFKNEPSDPSRVFSRCDICGLAFHSIHGCIIHKGKVHNRNGN